MRAGAARGAKRGKPQTRGKSRSSRAKAPGMLDALPLPADTIRRAGGWIFLGMLIAVAIAVGAALGVPAMLGTAAGEAVGEAGFTVRRVEIKGLERMERLTVYAVALDQDSMAMPLVDLDYTRERLLRLGWVKEARVSRRLPDTLVVDIVERQPAAIWQHRRQLALIDSDGVVLEQVKLDAMPDLPLVIGAQANHHAGELGLLLDGAPSLKPMLAGATWVGGRRWDVRFQSGETLALPEGKAAAQKALLLFARMDQSAQLLGRGYARFDMRIPGKMITRLSRAPGSTVPVLAPETGVGAPDPATTI